MQKKEKGAVALAAPSAISTILFQMHTAGCTPDFTHAAVSSTAAGAVPGVGTKALLTAISFPEFPFSATVCDGLTPSNMQILRLICEVQRQWSQSSVWCGPSHSPNLLCWSKFQTRTATHSHQCRAWGPAGYLQSAISALHKLSLLK